MSHICDLHHSSWLHWILNPLSEFRDLTQVLMDASLFGFVTHGATMGIPRLPFSFVSYLNGFHTWSGKGHGVGLSQTTKGAYFVQLPSAPIHTACKFVRSFFSITENIMCTIWISLRTDAGQTLASLMRQKVRPSSSQSLLWIRVQTSYLGAQNSPSTWFPRAKPIICVALD